VLGLEILIREIYEADEDVKVVVEDVAAVSNSSSASDGSTSPRYPWPSDGLSSSQSPSSLDGSISLHHPPSSDGLIFPEDLSSSVVCVTSLIGIIKRVNAFVILSFVGRVGICATFLVGRVGVLAVFVGRGVDVYALLNI